MLFCVAEKEIRLNIYILHMYLDNVIKVAQRKRGGPITHRSQDRNLALIYFLHLFHLLVILIPYIYTCSVPSIQYAQGRVGITVCFFTCAVHIYESIYSI
jgi:translation elongation factor EF-4